MHKIGSDDFRPPGQLLKKGLIVLEIACWTLLLVCRAYLQDWGRPAGTPTQIKYSFIHFQKKKKKIRYALVCLHPCSLEQNIHSIRPLLLLLLLLLLSGLCLLLRRLVHRQRRQWLAHKTPAARPRKRV